MQTNSDPLTARDSPAIEIRQLRKTFGAPGSAPALRDVSLTVRRGEMVALLGASGSGKSTLLRHVNGLQRADANSDAEIRVLGRLVLRRGTLAPDIRRTRSKIAIVFQQFNLVDRLPVMINVLAGALHRLPLWRAALRRFPAHELQRAHEALVRVGIERCAWQRASTLSGGQQQRAAISRAIVQGAEIVLADEPIASLDPESSRRVMQLLADLNRDFGTTVLVCLHQVEFALAFCPRTIALRDGVVVYDGPSGELGTERLRALYGSKTDELFAPASTPTAADRAPQLEPIAALQAA